MPWWNFLLGSASGVIDAGRKVYTAVAGDEAAKDQALSAEQVAILNAYMAEFSPRAQRTPWDSFVDGLNRLIRPALAIGAQGAFVWAMVDPVSFVETMQALAIVPEPLWFIWAGIFAFYFGSRLAENLPRKWKVEPKAMEIARQVADDRAARRAMQQAGPTVQPTEPPAQQAGPADGRQLTLLPRPGDADDVEPAEPVYAGPTDNATDPLRAMAATIWGEARGESFEGKVAVAWVIINRSLNPGWWGDDIRSVCTARWQFSCWFDAQAERVRFVDERNEKFAACLDVAKRVIAGEMVDPTGGADHYYADYIAAPKWARGRTPTARIGRHLFFRLGLGG